MKIRLRDYQQRGVKGITEKLLSGVRKLAYVLATGGGKTIIFSFIAKAISRLDKNVTIIVHRKKLVLQSSLALASIGLPHKLVAAKGVIKQTTDCHIETFGKSYINEKAPVTIASVQTLAKRLELLFNCNMIIIDECHHANIGYWKTCIDAASKATVLGVTATLIRLDGKPLGDVFDDFIQGPSMQELIDKGYLCRPRVFASKEQIDLSSVRRSMGDFNTGDLAIAMDKPYLVGNAIEHYKYLCDKVPAIAYCCTIAHAEHVAKEFRASGYNAICLTSKESEAEQFHILQQLAKGEIDVVTSVDIISEGTDVPLVGCGISLRPTASEALWDQQFGRPLRTYPEDSPIMQREHMRKLIDANGQHTAFILDHAGNSHRHGLPVYGRTYTLHHDTSKRKRKDSNPVKIATCPDCNNIHEPMQFCPECGHKYEVVAKKFINAKSGELVEIDITPEWAGKENLETGDYKTLIKKASTLEQIEAIATARGYQYSWVLRQVRMRYDMAAKYKHKARV